MSFIKPYSIVLRRVLSLLLVLITLSFTGCKQLTQASGDAQKQTQAFHDAMKVGNWAQMYADADPTMREKATQQQFTTLMSAVQHKLGDPVSFKQVNFRINTTTNGIFLSSVCETVFSKDAKGTESFVWRADGDKYRVVGYHINSEELITR
jgi:hypothetical protein